MNKVKKDKTEKPKQQKKEKAKCAKSQYLLPDLRSISFARKQAIAKQSKRINKNIQGQP